MSGSQLLPGYEPDADAIGWAKNRCLETDASLTITN